MFNSRHNLKHRENSIGQILTVTLGIGLLLMAVSESHGAILKLREVPCGSSGNVVTLGDVAEVLDADPNRVRALREIFLAPSPAPGGEILLDHEEIKRRLQAVGVNPLEIEFQGESRVRVKGTTIQKPVAVERPQQISSSQQQKSVKLVEGAVEEFLSRRYPHAGRFVASARMSEEQMNQLVPEGIQRISVSGGTAPFAEEQTYLVEFTTKEGEGRVLQIPCEAAVVPRVLALLRPVSRGQIIKVEDLGWRNPTDQEMKKLPQAQPQQVIGREATRDMTGGEAITSTSVRTVPLVSSGDVITVYSRRGGITVRCDVKAMGTAGLGETVLVQHGSDSRVRLAARVTGYHEATLTDDAGIREEGIGNITSGNVSPASINSSSGGLSR